MIVREVDYLQYSIPFAEIICKREGHKPIDGIRWYDRGYQDELLVRRYFGNPNSDKCLTVMSGKALHNYRAVNWDIRDWIKDAIKARAKFSRVDIAITEDDEEQLFLPKDIVELYRQQKLESKHVKYGIKWIASMDEQYRDGIQTVYIGDMKHRGARGIFRAYDKGLEMDIGKFKKSRIEIEDKHDAAHVTAKRIANGNELGSVFRTRMNSESQLFERLMDAESMDTSRGAEIIKSDDHIQHENRKKWLLKQVAPAMVKVLTKEPEFYNHFLMKIKEHNHALFDE